MKPAAVRRTSGSATTCLACSTRLSKFKVRIWLRFCQPGNPWASEEKSHMVRPPSWVWNSEETGSEHLVFNPAPQKDQGKNCACWKSCQLKAECSLLSMTAECFLCSHDSRWWLDYLGVYIPLHLARMPDLPLCL